MIKCSFHAFYQCLFFLQRTHNSYLQHDVCPEFPRQCSKVVNSLRDSIRDTVRAEKFDKQDQVGPGCHD